MHSSWFSTLFSIASAGLPKTARHTWVWMDMRAGRRRISRFGVFEEDSARQTMSSRARTPTRYPRVLSLRVVNERGQERDDAYLRSRSFMPLTRFWVYWTISEKRNANAEAEISAVRVLLRFRS